jgi:RimJ/RimL family protein N-acetyltransferase
LVASAFSCGTRNAGQTATASGAALRCRDWALGELGLTRLISLIARENTASIRVAEKLGERFEGDVADGFFRHPVGVWSLSQRRE